MQKAYTTDEWKALFPIKEFTSEDFEKRTLVIVKRASTLVSIRLDKDEEPTTHYVDAGYFDITVEAGAFTYPDQGPSEESRGYDDIRALPIAIQRAVAYVESHEQTALAQGPASG